MSSKKRKRKSNRPRRDREGPGFAAFFDLRDSTFVWNQNPDLAEKILSLLGDTVRGAIKNWQGTIENFTGDGFLVLFPQAEHAIRGLATVIENWEQHRTRYYQQLDALGAPLPDRYSLMLRTGVAYGFYRSFRMMGRDDVAGEAINRASRCESGSKTHFETVALEKSLAPHQRIFVTHDVVNLIKIKTDFWYSDKLPVNFKGYERPIPTGHSPSTDHIVAVWPKISRPAGEIVQLPSELLNRAARGASKIDIADRLIEAARRAEVADSLRDAVQDLLGRPAREVLGRAISTYQEALALVPRSESASRWADIQERLGLALTKVSQLTAGTERAGHLEQAVSAFREALKVWTLDSSPDQYAETQNYLGIALRNQADLLAGAERATRLEQAVSAFREALKVWTLDSSPDQYARMQNNLGSALRNQAELLAGAELAARLEQAVSAIREALKVFSLDSSPAQYAGTQNNLGIILNHQARLLAGAERAARLKQAVSAYREALKVRKLDFSPADYARTQNNLGTALNHQAELLAGAERAARLEQAKSALSEALHVYTLADFPQAHQSLRSYLDHLNSLPKT